MEEKKKEWRFLKKTEQMTTIWPRASTPWEILGGGEGNRNTNLKRYIHPSVHSSVTYNCQSIDASINRWTATHSNILAWKIPWTEEPGRLQSMGLQRVGHAEQSVPTLGIVINDFFCYLSYSTKVLESENLQLNTSYWVLSTSPTFVALPVFYLKINGAIIQPISLQAVQRDYVECLPHTYQLHSISH